jgi:hypothetical protein
VCEKVYSTEEVLLSSARIIVKDPIRPIYMDAIRMLLAATPSEEVIPILKPTVERAETSSKTRCMTLI